MTDSSIEALVGTAPIFTTATFTGDDAADTFGWDVVYALNASVINQALADYFSDGKLDDALVIDETMATFAPFPSVYMKGKFGPWQIATGGAGALVNLTIPIVSGSAGAVGYGEPIDLAGGEVSVQVKLGFHAVPNDLSPPGSVSTALKIVTSGNAPAAGSAADIASAASATGSNTTTTSLPDTVSVLGATIPGQNADSLLVSSIRSMVEQWMQNNLGVFDYVFLTADVAETAATGEWAWIKPTFVGYAYTDVLDADGNADINDSVFGIMSMTEGRVPQNPDGSWDVTAQVSAAGIPSNSGVNAALLLNQSLAVEKIIYPNLPLLFEGAELSDFSWSGQKVTNVNALTLKLYMDPAWYSYASNPCMATIPAAALSVEFNQTNVQQTFANITFPYGVQDEINVTLALTSTSLVGTDQFGQFMMQYDADTVSTISAQPDPTKAALESLEGLGVNLVMTALCCCDGFGAAPVDAGASGNIAGPASIDPIAQIDPVADEPNPAINVEPSVDGGSDANEPNSGINPEPSAEEGSDSSNLTPEQQSVASEIENSVAAGETGNGSIEMQNANLRDIGPNQLGEQVGEDGITEMRNRNPWKLKDIVPRFTFKVWAMFVGMISGDLYGDMSNFDLLTAYAQDPTKMPTLANFLDGCIDQAVWTNTGDQKLVCAGLNGPFIMGFTVASQSPASSAV